MNIVFSWLPIYTPTVKFYGRGTSAWDWVYVVKWFDLNNVMMPDTAGLYVICDNAGTPVYAGQAESLRERFQGSGPAGTGGRSEVLRELGYARSLAANSTLPAPFGYAHAATVSNKLDIDHAEAWLVRYLFAVGNYGISTNPLQNILLLNGFTTATTWNITHNVKANGVVPPAINPWFFTYAPGTNV